MKQAQTGMGTPPTNTQRHPHTDTDRHRQTQTDTDTPTQTHRDTHRHRHTHTHTHKHRHRNRQTNKTDRHTHTHLVIFVCMRSLPRVVRLHHSLWRRRLWRSMVCSCIATLRMPAMHIISLAAFSTFAIHPPFLLPHLLPPPPFPRLCTFPFLLLLPLLSLSLLSLVVRVVPRVWWRRWERVHVQMASVC